MSTEIPQGVSKSSLQAFVLALADDELVLGHRDSEWTGYAPILEEDIAFSNIAQDELGHSLIWYSLYEKLGGQDPDRMGFEREWKDFICCRFVTYPKGDFAYTVVRQFLFDVAEEERLELLKKSTFAPLTEIAEKIIREEAYHILHTQGLVERLGDATEESHRRMQAAAEVAFPQALGMFETLEGEEELVKAGVFAGNKVLREAWLRRVVPVFQQATLTLPVDGANGSYQPRCSADEGGRKKQHTEHLKPLVDDLQSVYRSIPKARW
ncbi:MAG TPA: 1,2-phenylacetyl-CoA epoxidase subunit PaaC [Bacteroidota bacterium]|nr:1,2-phenylacetyl-CoA epoxidase subunit PaaC [Bacteroidota bacterium]